MPGYILLFLQPRNDQTTRFLHWRKEIFSSRADMSHYLYLDAVGPVTELEPYRHMNVYRLEGSLPSTTSDMEEHLESSYANSHLSKFHIQIYNCLAEIRQSPLPAATVVTVGMTIPTDLSSHQKLDQWYTQEHIPGLATVPGWQAGIRLQLLHASDTDAEYAAPYLAIHEWAEPNGLGGEVWKKACFTPWTERITELQTAPIYRRSWKSV